MTTLPLLENWLSPALVRAVGYTLLHSLWQGAALAGVLAAALPLLRRHRAEVRYATAAGALASLLLLVGLTFGFYYTSGPVPAETTVVADMAPVAAASAVSQASVETIAAAPATASEQALDWLQTARTQVEPYLPLLVAAWLVGLLLMSGRLLGGLVYANRLRRAGAQALGTEWQQRLAALAHRAGLRRPVALLESARVAGPLVLGHLRPAILLPLGAVAGLSPALLEALLAHELAHIVRRDYLLNLGLAVAEVLFFYHPAVWFMAGCLRAERENCCDDQAAALCGGDRLRVARALAALAELETIPAATPRLALAATGVGGRGSLLARVRRLALARPSAPTLGEGLLAGVLAGLGLLGLGTGVVLAAPADSLVQREAAATAQQLAANLVGTSRNSLAAGAPPAWANVMRQFAAPYTVASNDPRVRVLAGSSVQVYSPTQAGPRPRRRGDAGTVVIEKDKKGRVISLTVDGQPVETATDKRAKKVKKGKGVRTVEIVQVPTYNERPERLERIERLERPERLERLERLDDESFRFNFNLDGLGSKVARETRRGFAEALRDPNLTAHDRREIERALSKLKNDVHIDVQALVDTDPTRPRRRVLRYNLNRNLSGTADLNQAARTLRENQRYLEQAQREADQADRNAELADRNAELADRAAALADRAGEQADRAGAETDAAVRRAELRARIAAAEAELRALDGTNGRGSLRRITPPRPPRAPLPPSEPQPFAPAAPDAPQAPLPPAPPAPPAAPNTGKLRDALRQDGLIGSNDRRFSFELNDDGGRVNGQALTSAQVEKYRQLLNKPAGKGKGKSTFNITVDER
ncbi:MAG: M56 family metallopeptidase [Janthinobacterium lividum]